MSDGVDVDIAIAHEHYPARGGGEHVADELGRIFDAPVYTGYVADGNRADDVVTRELFGTGLSGFLLKREYPGHIYVRDAFYQFAWPKVTRLTEYDVVIQSGNNPTWYVPQEDQAIVKYCHSPPRNPYDLWHEHHPDASIIYSLYCKLARQTWPTTASSVDVWVANSELVARRIEQATGIPQEDIRVIYPPTDFRQFDPGARETGDYYLALSRLTPEKGFDTIIDEFAALGADYPLRIAGDGWYRDDLEERAADCDHIEFLGYVSEEHKRALLAGAKGLVFNATNEDFGMVPVEAFASGTPVIGVADGFTQYQIIDGKNGYTFGREGGELRAAIRTLDAEGVDWTGAEIREWAHGYFSRERFAAEMHRAVAAARRRAAIDVPWQDEMPHLGRPPDDTDADSDDAVVADPPEVVADGGDG